LREQVLRQQQLHERASILRNAQVRLLLQNGRRNQGKSLNIYSDVWDWNGSKSGPNAW